jgi:hypothetical protein
MGVNPWAGLLIKRERRDNSALRSARSSRLRLFRIAGSIALQNYFLISTACG